MIYIIYENISKLSTMMKALCFFHQMFNSCMTFISYHFSTTVEDIVDAIQIMVWNLLFSQMDLNALTGRSRLLL